MLDSMVLHKSGPRPDLAHRFIDIMLEGENSAKLTNLIGSGNPNRAARRYIAPAIAANQAVFPTPDIQRRLEMLSELDPEAGAVANVGGDQGALSDGELFRRPHL